MSQSSRRGRKVQQDTKKQSSMRVFYIVIAGVALGGLALLATTLTGQESAAEFAPSTVSSAAGEYETGRTEEGFYYKGNPDAPVTVIEYADYQCPHCADFSESVFYRETLPNEYLTTGQVQYIFHDFPLSPSTNAMVASQASYCAGDQEATAFWEMHNRIFEAQSQWAGMPRASAVTRFADMVEEAGLDRAAFETCMADGTYEALVTDAARSATQAGIPGTPTFVVNGNQVNALQLPGAIQAAVAANS